MPQSDDLVGLGVAPQLAAVIGNQANTLTCTGSSSQSGAATVKTHNTELTAASGSANSAVIPSTALVGTPWFFFTSSSTSAIVYVPSGHYLNGSLNVGLTIAQNKMAILFQYKKGYWGSILTA